MESSTNLPGLPAFISHERHRPSRRFGELAQLGERLVCNQEVTGSSPVFSTSLRSQDASYGSASRPSGRRPRRSALREGGPLERVPKVWEEAPRKRSPTAVHFGAWLALH